MANHHPRLTPKIVLAKDLNELAQLAAADFFETTERALAKEGHCNVLLSGGGTPAAMYGVLRNNKAIQWEKIRFFFGDERFVAHTDKQSNFNMAQRELFNHVPVPKDHVFAFETEGVTPEVAAKHYEMLLRQEFAISKEESPVFDLVYLGLGEDGHTASLFLEMHPPLTEARESLAIAPFIPKLNSHRLTLTPIVFNHAAKVIFLIAGESKSQALQTFLNGPFDPSHCPAQLIHPTTGELLIFADHAAGVLLK